MPSSHVNSTRCQYKEVRGLSRGLDVLKALNAEPGGIASTTAIARACGLDRTTTKRLLETLRMEGFVRQGEREGQYYLTFEVRRLAEGFEDETWVGQVATPLMAAAVRDLVWPCDIGTAEAGFMVVRESTHRLSPLSQHRAMIGERLPMLLTAIGRAYLTACDDAERDATLELLRQRTDTLGGLARDKARVRRVLKATRERGYAYNDGEWQQQAGFAAVAVPVHAGERLLAALNLIFPKASVSRKDLEERFVPALRRLAGALGKASRNWLED
jgi:IclR family mhp operon transcriptional activator